MSATSSLPPAQRAYLFAALAILAWSTVATAFKLALRDLVPAELLFYAAWTSVLLLGGILWASGRWRELRHHSGRQLLQDAGLGLLNPFLYYLLLFAAYARLPAQEAQPLNYAWPLVLSVLAAVFLRQPLRPLMLGGLLLGFAGVAVIATRGDPLALRLSDPPGVGLALASTLVWASYWLLSLRARGDPLARLWLGFVAGALSISLYVLVAGVSFSAWGGGHLWSIYVGCFEMGITFVWWLSALRHAENAAQVAVLVYLSPFLSLGWIALVLGETILPSTLLGLGLIVVGILLPQISGMISAR